MPPEVPNRAIKHRRQAVKSWWKKDKELIEIIKQHKNFNEYCKRYSRHNLVWQELSKRLNMPADYCKRKWFGIKYKYMKLKNMIHIGRVTEDMVRKHEKTSMYLDGSLDFLDPFVFEIPDSELPSYAHDFFYSIFEANDGDSNVGAEKLIKIQGNSHIEIIKDYKQESGIEPTSILPNNENYDSDSSSRSIKEEFVDLGMNQPMREEEIDENDVYDVEDILPNTQINQEEETNNTSTNENMEMNVTSSSRSLWVKKEFVDLGMNQPMREEIDENDVYDVEDILPNTQIKQDEETNNTSTNENMEMNVTSSSRNLWVKKEFVDLGMNQPMREEIDENDVYDVEDILPNTQIKQEEETNNTSTNENMEMNVTSSSRSLWEDSIMQIENQNQNKALGDCVLARFLINYKYTSVESNENNNLKKYMCDLAEVVCCRLVPEKRKYFFSQIDLMVSELLEET